MDCLSDELELKYFVIKLRNRYDVDKLVELLQEQKIDSDRNISIDGTILATILLKAEKRMR